MSTLSLITVSLNKGNICATSASLNLLEANRARNLLWKNLLLLRLAVSGGSVAATSLRAPTRVAEIATFSRPHSGVTE